MPPHGEATWRTLDNAVREGRGVGSPGVIEDVNGLIEQLQNAVVLVHLLYLLGVQKQGVPQIARTLAVDEEVRDVLHVDRNGQSEHAVGDTGGAVLRMRRRRRPCPVDGEEEAAVSAGFEGCVERGGVEKVGQLRVRRQRRGHFLHVGWDHARLDAVAKAAAFFARACQRREDKVWE